MFKSYSEIICIIINSTKLIKVIVTLNKMGSDVGIIAGVLLKGLSDLFPQGFTPWGSVGQ